MKKQTLYISLMILCFFSAINSQTATDSLIKSLEFKTISQADYTYYLLKETQRLTNEIESDSTFFKKRGLTLKSYCDQVCESYLIEDKTDKKLWLPASFDQGILGITFSPSKDYLMVFSSYDRPDYDNYYEYRADIFIYKITKSKGLELLDFYFNFYTKDWSIEDIVWIDNSSIALKIYEEGRFGNGENLRFKYFKTSFK